MEVENLKEEEMPLFSRKRVTFLVKFPKAKTISNDEVKKFIATKYKVDEKLIAVKKINQHFGKPEAEVIVHIYKSEKDLEKLENIRKKKFKKEEKKEEEKKEVKEGEESEKKGEEQGNK